MIKYIKGISYCERQDLEQLGVKDIAGKMRDYRKGKSGRYANISDPTHNGRGRKRLIEISSLPDSLQARVRNLLGQATEATKEVLELTEMANPAEVVKVATEAVENTIEISLPYIVRRLEQLSPNTEDINQIQSLFLVDLVTATKWSLLRSVARFYQNEAQKLRTSLERRTLRRMIVKAQKQSVKLLDNLPKLSAKVLLKAPSDITPKNAANQNASKGAGDKDIENWLRAHYGQGNLPKVSHIYKVYLIERVELGFPEVTKQTLYNWVKPIKMEAELRRKGLGGFKLDNTITINRTYPKQFGAVLSMDATPLNAWVWNEKKQKSYQSMWRCTAEDVTTSFLVAKASQYKESVSLYIETFREFVRVTAMLPRVVEVDHFTGWKKFKEYLAFFGVELHPVAVKNSRGKLAENGIGIEQDFIERYDKAFSGLNIDSNEGKLSEEFVKIARKNSLTYTDAVRKIEIDNVNIWNEHVMEQRNRKKCGKSPNQLREEFPPVNEKLSKEMYYRVVGNWHQVTLGKDGLVVNHYGVEYIYFPCLDPAKTEATADFFNRHIGLKFKLYIIKYTSPALVCDLSDRVVGYWELKPFPAYNHRDFEKGDGKVFQKLRAIQEAQVKLAEQAQSEAEQHYPDAAESFIKMHQGEGDKDIHMMMENVYKLDSGELVDTETGEILKDSQDGIIEDSKREWIEFKHPITGEIKYIKKD